MSTTNNDRTSAPASPSVATRRGAGEVRGKVTGVTRIGSRAGIIAIGGVAALVIGIFLTLGARGSHGPGVAAATVPTAQALATGAPLIDGIPGAVPTAAPVIRATPAPQRTPPLLQVPPRTPARQPVETAQNALQTVGEVPQIAGGVSARSEAPAALRQAERQRIADVERSARTAPLLVQGIAPAAAASSAGANQSGATGVLASARQDAVSPYEIQAGSVIPATLLTGINSDVPGTIVAQVNHNVYDSKTGQYLLVPSGSKLIGHFDSGTGLAPGRTMVAWQRIICPDGSSIDIGSMDGVEGTGTAGLAGKVNNHTNFIKTALYSLIGVGSALLQPRVILATTGNGMMVMQGPTVAQQVATGVGTQAQQSAQQALSANGQQRPTVEVSPGYLFNVLVSRDLVLPAPYKG